MPFLWGALTGAGFGVVLYKVGATRYSRVMGMLTMRDTKVVKFAFTAIGVASIAYGLAAAAGVAEPWGLVPRVMPFLGSAHLLGGALFGIGMGISGLCPGTCVAKAGGRGGQKKFATPAAVLGLVAGVLLYGALKDPLMAAGIVATNQKPLTLHGLLGLPYAAVALGWGALFLVLPAGIDRFFSEKVYQPARERRTPLDWIRGEWSWPAAGVVGGLLVVVATAQGGYLGFSGAILAAVGWAASLVGLPLETVPRITPDIVWRAALIVGVFPGAYVAHLLSIPSRAAAEAPAPKVLDLRAVATSFGAATVMCLGALVGGGCTTGAFIAAWPTLSLGSLAMAGTFFVVSMATSTARLSLIRSYDLAAAQEMGDRVYD
ncbi:MAG TPA: YeeE/YedE thiosulfate transporter family protein [Anaeromyxobacteraceae bacterium]|nr:YeeE/YedE thiosulfate transporter family protein [Anaeromyxobacteraceae bacterium]